LCSITVRLFGTEIASRVLDRRKESQFVMYGMVNKALEEMVCDAHGEEVWEKIKLKAGVEVDVFISQEGYPDEMTYQLVGAASEVLNAPAADLLEAFGGHWVLKTAVKGYGHLMTAAGSNLKEFLVYLPNFHTRISLIFPHLNPPRFLCSEVAANSLNLHYYSDRPGLAPFVRGLVKGLGQHYKTEVTVEQTGFRGPDLDHDVFKVNWS
jgi:hypothetical protein